MLTDRKKSLIYAERKVLSCVKWRASRITIFYGFIPLYEFVYIFSSCVFYTLHYTWPKGIADSNMVFFYIHFHYEKSKKKNCLLIFIHHNSEIIMPNFFRLQANMGRRQQRIYTYYVSLSVFDTVFELKSDTE